MKAKFVRKLSEDTSLFQCDPPMKFLKPTHDVPGTGKITRSALVVAWSGEVAEGLPRAVLHSAHLLAGDDGLGYGADGARVFDAKMNHHQALQAAGYAVEFENGCAQSECMNRTTGCPPGQCQLAAQQKANAFGGVKVELAYGHPA